jgi:hypothetical protein
VREGRAAEKEKITMAAKKITYIAEATINGTEIRSTRTSHRAYTHAAVRGPYQSGGYGVTFHGSAAQASRKNEYGPVALVVEVKIEGAEAAPVEVEAPVNPALAEIAEKLDKGAHAAKTHESMSALTKAAALVLEGKTEEARKVLVPLRTRVALAGIAAIKAL